MKTNEDRLKAMLDGAHEELEDFLAMGKNSGARLDFSIESISDLERILIQTNATEEDDEDLFYDAWLYTGLVVANAKQGKWIVSEEDDETNGYPAIQYSNMYNDIFCPLTAVRQFLASKKTGAILSSLH